MTFKTSILNGEYGNVSLTTNLQKSELHLKTQVAIENIYPSYIDMSHRVAIYNTIAKFETSMESSILFFFDIWILYLFHYDRKQTLN